ncbi:MAG: hypothetical protein KF799_12270 [Bdellovibrionales bacterium]|nr:hypothetical protein [Bdellovibrionales bacterium]
MTLTLSAPSKTFLAGEYAVLAKAPALILNTGPRFELRVRAGHGEVTGLHPESPAGQWLEQRRPLLEKYALQFHDPHSGAGGLGASGAQFLLVHTLTTYLQSSFEKTMSGPDLKDVWKDHDVLSRGRGSGADLLAQATGRVSVVDMATLSARAEEWPYPELGWVVVRTQQKIPTHEHLQTLDRAAISLLSPLAAQCVQAFASAPSEVFLGHVKDFTARLSELGLQAAHAQTLVKHLENEDWCLAAKGCGALGADTVLAFYPTEARERAAAFLRKSSLQVVASLNDLSGGLELQWH